MSFRKRIGERFKSVAQPKAAELISHGPELYGYGRRSKGTQRSAYEQFLATVQPGEGSIYGEFIRAGYRRLMLSAPIHAGKSALLLDGYMPTEDDRLTVPQFNLKARYAASSQLFSRIEVISVNGNTMGVEIKDRQVDTVPYAVYRLGAQALAETYPELEAVRLGVDQWAQGDAQQIKRFGAVIARSSLVPPEGPAQAT